MKLVYNNGYIWLTLIFLLLSPLLALPFIIYGIYNRYKASFFLMSVFLGLLAFLTGPTGDLYRHTLLYYAHKYYTFEDISIILTSGDFITQLLSYFCAKNDIPYPFLRFLYTLVSYNILFYVFNYYVINSKIYTKNTAFHRFIILIMVSDFFLRVYGVRYVMAVTIFLLAYHYYFIINEKVSGLIILAIAIFIHYSLLYYSVILFAISYYKVDKRNIWVLAFIVFIIGIIGYQFIIMIAGTIKLQYFGYLSEGTYGTGNLEHEAERAGITRVVNYLYERIAIIFASMFILNEFYDKTDNKCRFLYGVVLLFCLMSRFGAASGRILFICEFLMINFMLFNECRFQRLINNKIFLLVFFLLFFRFFIQLVGYGNIVRVSSDYDKMLYPITEVLSVDYDLEWMFKNVNPDGSIKR